MISLGENLVGTSAPLPAQLFTVVFALAGLVSFALVLALVEQVILTLVEDNVTTGEARRQGRLPSIMCGRARVLALAPWLE